MKDNLLSLHQGSHLRGVLDVGALQGDPICLEVSGGFQLPAAACHLRPLFQRQPLGQSAPNKTCRACHQDTFSLQRLV